MVIFTGWVLYQFVLAPILSVLRLTQVFDSGLLVRYVNTAIVLILLAAAPWLLHRIRSWFQFALLAVGLQAAVVGLVYGQFQSSSAYASHLFQILVAFVMFSFGYDVASQVPYRAWRRGVLVALGGGLVGAALALGALVAGLVPRFYGPSYPLLFVIAACLPAARWHAAGLAGALIFVSNKRGVVLAAMVGALTWAVGGTRITRKTYQLLVASLLVASIAVAIVWLEPDRDGGGMIAEAVTRGAGQTVDRLDAAIGAVASGDLERVDVASAGRVGEIEYAVAEWDWWTPFLGRGAGVLMGPTHFIHFSPLSVATVYGPLFAVMIYGYGLVLAFRSIGGTASRDPRLFVAGLYVIMAAIYSLFAYSLFVDLFVFCAMGLMARAVSTGRRGWTRHIF